MKIAFSPCPNDTFVFHAWVHGFVPDAPSLHVTYADIDQTNRLAAETDSYDVLKISCAALPWVQDSYTLIPCGGALGRGCGPLVLVRDGVKLDPSSLTGSTVAVPSERSTAYLLFRLWASQTIPHGVGEIRLMPFHQIMPAVQKGEVDAGLVIHEARFTYPSYDLVKMVDLGEWWESDTGHPIPLGAIIARRSLDPENITRWIQSSVQLAWKNPAQSQGYILKHAQEMDPLVAQAHIDLYVNSFTADLGQEGMHAIHSLLGRAAEEGLVPPIPQSVLQY